MTSQDRPGTRSAAAPQAHYFTNTDAPAQERTLTVELGGRSLSVTTADAIFSPGGVDKGTAVLLENAPFSPQARPEQGEKDPRGEAILDIGCGWGPITITAGLASPQARLYAVDVNERSIDLTRRNAAAAGLSATVCRPEEIDPELGFDRIYSNPPIRVGKEALHAILRQWLPRLNPSGTAWLVVQKNLGADSLLAWMGREFPELECARHSTSKGFRILTAHRRP